MRAAPIAPRVLTRPPRARIALAYLPLLTAVLVPDGGESAVRARRPAHAARPLLDHNANAADTSNADELAEGGASGFARTGRGVRVGIWDVGGVLASHQDLVGRVHAAQAADPSHHATHAAGTILGDGSGNAAARGMAPAASAIVFTTADTVATLEAEGGALSVSHHGYGPALGWFDNDECDDRPSWVNGEQPADPMRGKYDASAAAIDAAAFAGDDLLVWSAGNHRRPALPSGTEHYHHPSCVDVHVDDHASQDGHDTIGGPAIAKNVLSIGAIRDITVDPVAAAEVQPLPMSGFGPADDGRVKPDLVASGFSVFSTFAGADDAYGSLSGTSPAAAVVSGAVALLVEHYRALNGGIDPRAAELKAWLVQTAIDDADLPGPDAETGHGLVDARAAADLIAADAASAEGKRLRVSVLEAAAQTFTTVAEVPPGTPLRATLAWLDPPGPANTGGDGDPAPALVNDLDLVLVAPDGTTEFLPWSLDAEAPSAPATRSAPNLVDPVEVVTVTAAENVWAGVWTLRVSGTLAQGAAQAYALAASQALGPAPGPVLGAPRYLQATVQLGAPPALVLPVRNLGSGSLEFAIEDAPEWLIAEPATGEAPSDVQLAVDGTLVAPGEQRATLAIASSDPSGPRRVTLLLDVTACPADCAGRECGDDPVCGQSCGSCAAGELCEQGSCVPDPCADIECSTCRVCSNGVCVAADDELACDDGDACTQNDRCAAGVCTGNDVCDAGTDDGGSGRPDAGPDEPGDAGSAQPDASPTGGGKDDGGCGCRTIGGGERARGYARWLAAGLIAAAWVKRRRR